MVKILISISIVLLLSWLLLVMGLALVMPKRMLLKEALRILPDLLRLLHRLSQDQNLPRALRFRLYFLLGYLALPIDLIPDFIPVIGYADDAIIVVFVLRGVVRRTGVDVIAKHWPGSKVGLQLLGRLTGLELENS
jgi:uncharacterized membrane protein YkvA (DUF1232 family)